MPREFITNFINVKKNAVISQMPQEDHEAAEPNHAEEVLLAADSSKAFERGDDEGGLRIAAGIVDKQDVYNEIPPNKRRMLLDNLRLGKKQMFDPRPPTPFSCESARGIKVPAGCWKGSAH